MLPKVGAVTWQQPTLLTGYAEVSPLPPYISKRPPVRDWTTIPQETKEKICTWFYVREQGPVTTEDQAECRAAINYDFNGMMEDYSGIDLDMADLRNASFRRLNLHEASFKETDLRGAYFDGSHLTKIVSFEISSPSLHAKIAPEGIV